MATTNLAQGLQGPEILRKSRRWSIAIAIVFILLGIVAIVEPAVAGLTVAILLSWLLILGGVAHLIAALSGGSTGRVLWQVILGILYILGGSYFRTHPLMGLGSLTLLLA